ncbi:MAG TPA: metallophosphoesterase [Solirubrobacteraceae bacterium]|jgi:Icc-related predicted phosphoesterase|nr:metallophosphoesterase [Solirubrobacteraceae bacterium]
MHDAHAATDMSRLRIAAAGDLHCREDGGAQVAESMARVAQEADLVLLCGDLTTHGRPEQAAVLAEACKGLDIPVLAILGNHDWHCDRAHDVVAELQHGGIQVLERESRILDVAGAEVGVVGLKGFVGGFIGSHLPDFGEPLLRQVYAESTIDVEALDQGLRNVAMCPVRIVMLHYAPTTTTLEGEPLGIWPFLGTDRLAAPIAEHEPHIVIHGHAHSGTFRGAIGEVPVYNVSIPVIERDFWIFELDRQIHRGPAIH